MVYRRGISLARAVIDLAALTPGTAGIVSAAAAQGVLTLRTAEPNGGTDPCACPAMS
jgi:hypothetical protein